MPSTTLSLLERATQVFPDSSKSTIRKWIKFGRLYVEGAPAKKEGQQVSCNQKLELRSKEISPYPFKVLYEDKDLIVVHKPSFLLSVASLDPKERNVHSYLKKQLRPLKVFPVHRLDREVSGPLIFAKSKRAFELLQEGFYHREIKREYRALVEGQLEVSSGTWESFLQERKNYKVASSEHQGKLAITHYQVLSSNEDACYLSLSLDTGRKNQLRVHCSESGHPIVGDVKYGAQEGQGALALFAHTLTFHHPMTKKRLHFEVEPPSSFTKQLKRLELGV